MGLHPIMAAALAPFIDPAPDCIYCEQPVTDGSVQDYDGWAKAEPAHVECINDAAESAFSDQCESEPPVTMREQQLAAEHQRRELRR